MKNTEIQKQVYYVFSYLEDTKGFERSIYGLTVDYYINNANQYSSLNDISQTLKSISIFIAPERLYEALSVLNTSAFFERFPDSEDIAAPFRLAKSIYDDFCDTTDCIEQLQLYVNNYLNSKKAPIEYASMIIDILLETIFSRNITFLKNIVSSKVERSIRELYASYKSVNGYNEDVYSHYNNLLLESTNEFDDILQVLVLRMFDFLSLNYNPKYGEKISTKFANKCYYLDSSFIVRLLGFDGCIRTDRAKELLSILNGMSGVTFKVHIKTIEESESKIKEIISRNQDILMKNVNIVRNILDKNSASYSPLFSLYSKMIGSGVISNYSDFALYFSNVKKLLVKIIPGIEWDTKSFWGINSKREGLVQELNSKTDKTKKRIKHIVNLLDYIDNLRGANNYNPLDIRYWLITTDQKTLELDHEFMGKIDSGSAKSICIMPSEIIRLIDSCSGDIKGNHMHVFKKFMLKSHVFPQQYTDLEIATISKIATLVENVDTERYDINLILDNLFNNMSLKTIINRQSQIEKQRERDQALIDLFNESNEEYIENNFSSLFNLIDNYIRLFFKCVWYILIFIIPILCWGYVVYSVINWHNINLLSPKTYFNIETWDDLEKIMTVLSCIITPFFVHINKKYKDKFLSFISRKIKDFLRNKMR